MALLLRNFVLLVKNLEQVTIPALFISDGWVLADRGGKVPLRGQGANCVSMRKESGGREVAVESEDANPSPENDSSHTSIEEAVICSSCIASSADHADSSGKASCTFEQSWSAALL